MKILSCLCWGLQIIIGLAAVVSFVILWCSGDNMLLWIPTLLLALWLIGSGVYQITKLWKGYEET